MLAPPEHLAAGLEVLYRVAVETRVVSCRAASSWRYRMRADVHQRSADLLDAVHNIPVLLRSWERCDVSMLRGDLCSCDSTWRGHPEALYQLDEIYERTLRAV